MSTLSDGSEKTVPEGGRLFLGLDLWTKGALVMVMMGCLSSADHSESDLVVVDSFRDDFLVVCITEITGAAAPSD